MKFWVLASTFLVFSLGPNSVAAQSESEGDRLWQVGSEAYADQLYSVARRTLQRFVERFPEDARVSEATLLLGRAQLALGEPELALESLRRGQRANLPPGRLEEARFWEAEALFRLKRYREARAAYDALLAENAASPFAPDALYGRALCELELKRPQPAVTALREFLRGWPEHPLAPSATYHLARTLVELKQPGKAEELLAPFAARYPADPLLPEARYLLGWSRLAAGKIKAGVADLRAFLADYPGHELAPQARRLITTTLIRQGRKQELAEEYRVLANQPKPTPEALYDAGLIAQELGRSKDAEAAWNRLRSELPSHALSRRASLALAQAAFKREQYKTAAALGREASESEEGAVRLEGLLLVGESEIKSGRFQAALTAFGAAQGIKSEDPRLRFRALAGSALAHEELRHWADAAKLYEKVASESPDRDLRDWAKARLNAVRARAQPKAKRPS